MSTPIHDLLKADWSKTIESAEWRGRQELRQEVIETIKAVKRPTVELKKLLEKLEAENVR